DARLGERGGLPAGEAQRGFRKGGVHENGPGKHPPEGRQKKLEAPEREGSGAEVTREEPRTGRARGAPATGPPAAGAGKPGPGARPPLARRFVWYRRGRDRGHTLPRTSRQGRPGCAPALAARPRPSAVVGEIDHGEGSVYQTRRPQGRVE